MRRQLGRRLIIMQKRDTILVSLFCMIVFRKCEVLVGDSGFLVTGKF